MEKQMALHHEFAIRGPRWIKAVSLACVLALTACASGSKRSTIPSEGPTMSDVYRQHIEASGVGGKRSPRDRLPLRAPEDSPLTEYARTAINETDNRFARLPNLDLIMYVTPHLSANRNYPIPGYTTVFSMYETIEYAMPGELPARRSKWPIPESKQADTAPSSAIAEIVR
jgi:conjugative transfer region lipoprotein (TIGR03751 family)